MQNKKNRTLRVLVNHPYIGSQWLYNARIDENEVEGFVPDSHPADPSKQVWYPMHFPKSCIRQVKVLNKEPIRKWD